MEDGGKENLMGKREYFLIILSRYNNQHKKFIAFFFVYNLWKESLNSDGSQFHLHQQNEQSSLIIFSINDVEIHCCKHFWSQIESK